MLIQVARRSGKMAMKRIETPIYLYIYRKLREQIEHSEGKKQTCDRTNREKKQNVKSYPITTRHWSMDT